MVDIDSFRSFLVLPLASLILILVLVPVGKLLRRTGRNPGILALFPVLNLIALWFFAFQAMSHGPKSAHTGN